MRSYVEYFAGITRIACISGVLAVIFLSTSSAYGKAGFLIPGVDLSEVDFIPGTSVEYLVISEVYEVRDSSRVKLAVTGRRGDIVDIEITSSPWPGNEDEAVVIRIAFSDSIAEADTTKDVYSFINNVMVSESGGPFRKAEEDEIRDFDLHAFFSGHGDSRSERPERENVRTPAGEFECSVVEYSGRVVSEVKLGGNEGRRVKEESSVLYMSEEVPLWRLVMSVVTTVIRTEIDSPSFPRGMLRSKKTRMEAVLISYDRGESG